MGNGINIAKQKQRPYMVHLSNHLGAGDALVMTAAVESLAIQYPGQYLVNTYTTCQEIWQNNPHVRELSGGLCHVATMHFTDWYTPTTRHFMQAYCDMLGESLGIPLPCCVEKPALYLSDAEKATPVVKTKRPYLVVNSGYKLDMTCKAWGHASYQAVVSALAGVVDFVQVGESHNCHRPLEGVFNLIDKTTPRELFQLVYHSAGAIGGVTFLQHIAAALDKPYFCLLGGRESPSWLQYPKQTLFHTIGQLDCCAERGCWNMRTVPLNDGYHGDRRLCALPVVREDGTVPACMDMVKPSVVIAAIEELLRGKNGESDRGKGSKKDSATTGRTRPARKRTAKAGNGN